MNGMEKLQYTDFEAQLTEIKPLRLDFVNHLFYSMNTIRMKANQKYHYLCREVSGDWKLLEYHKTFGLMFLDNAEGRSVTIHTEPPSDATYVPLICSVADVNEMGVFKFIDDVLTHEYKNTICRAAKVSKVDGTWVFESGVKPDVDMGFGFSELRDEITGVMNGEIAAEVIQNPEIEPEVLDIYDIDAIGEYDKIVDAIEVLEIGMNVIDYEDLTKLAKAVSKSRKEGNGPFARNTQGQWISENNGEVLYYDDISTLCAKDNLIIRFN